MNTPTHLALATALLADREKPERTAWVIWGALLPDLIMLPLFLYELLRGVPIQVIFDEKYFLPYWQIPIDLSNSIPIYLAIAALALWRKHDGLLYLALAALLHILFDFPLHHDDAHAHFYPFSAFKFHSPVSYWDQDHYANWVTPFEFAILIIGGYFGSKKFQHKWARIAFIAFLAFMPLVAFGYMIMSALA